MKLHHGTSVKFNNPIAGYGKSGYGLYAYKSNSAAMRNYYDNGHIAEFTVDDKHIVDLTTRNNYTHAKTWLENQLSKKISKATFQQSGHMLQSFIAKFYPEAKAFINFHFGFGIPTSKEVIVINTEVIENFRWIK